MAGNIFAVGSLGGLFDGKNLSDELLKANMATQKFRQFADVKNAWNTKRSGETFTWDLVENITRANRALTETNTIPQGNATVLQGTLTISERGVAVPYTGKLEKLAQIAVRKPIMDRLKYDSMCDLDALAHQQFNNCLLRLVGTAAGAMTTFTTGTATDTSSSALTTTHVKSCVDLMKDRNIRPYAADDYIAIGRHGSYRTFKNALESLHQYTETGLEMIFNGEIGRYEGVRFIQQTNIPAGGGDVAADAFNAFTGASGAWATAGADWVFFFGADTVAEGVNTPEEVRFKETSDYQRAKGVAWYYLGGFGQARGTTEATVAEATILKFASAD
jgi:N4-gp56 family major capsid protein